MEIIEYWPLSNDQGTPAVSYKWTGWVWEITSRSWRLQENYWSFRGIYRIYPNLVKENRRMSTCNQLDFQTLGCQPVMPKISPITGLETHMTILFFGLEQSKPFTWCRYQCMGVYIIWWTWHHNARWYYNVPTWCAVLMKLKKMFIKVCNELRGMIHTDGLGCHVSCMCWQGLSHQNPLKLR